MNVGGGSENVTVPLAEIRAEISLYSICFRERDNSNDCFTWSMKTEDKPC